jgi:aminopeptidase N
LENEPRLAIWEQVLRDFEAFDELSKGEPARAAVQRFARGLIAPRFAALGWDERGGEGAEAALLRGRLAAALARYGDAATIAEGRARFDRYAASPSSIAPDLVDAVFEIAGRNADAATYDTLLALARRATTSEERFRAYRAIAAAADDALAARSVRLANDAGVPQIVRHRMLAAIADAGHRPLAWRYAGEHVDELLADMKLYEGGAFFTAIVESSADAADADQLEAFALAHLRADALVEVRRGEDEIRTRAALKARLLPQLESALAAR